MDTDHLEDKTRMARTPDVVASPLLTTCPSENSVQIEARASKFSVLLSDQNFQRGK
jgi:hypothetical protein